jgi:hypothetical protein
MNNLFSLSAQYQQLMDRVNEADEISDELMQAIEDTSDSLENKVLNYTAMIKEIEAKAKAIEDAMHAMSKRAVSLIKASDRLKESVKQEMEHCEKKKIQNEYHSVSLILNNPKVNYTDKALIPTEYMRRKITEIVEPNGNMILQALKENITVPGANMVREHRLQIR